MSRSHFQTSYITANVNIIHKIATNRLAPTPYYKIKNKFKKLEGVAWQDAP